MYLINGIAHFCRLNSASFTLLSKPGIVAYLHSGCKTMLHVSDWRIKDLQAQAVPGLWLCSEPVLKSSLRLFCWAVPLLCILTTAAHLICVSSV